MIIGVRTAAVTPTEVYREGFIETPDVTVLEKTTTP
jgi:hypothetical protein